MTLVLAPAASISMEVGAESSDAICPRVFTILQSSQEKKLCYYLMGSMTGNPQVRT
jgi:hypothetical protein